ncbi:hypothetical protein SODALDRAFT_134392 [Sodiomyces alkalinus F11]|uniref:Uncharacterized protein n=1 Tax=Sodiomyces alkalinus (strain CBS 110278 / VKM F-3762 / F11) TaxID=1314773 RepID=A0A3N2PYM5_SODAK|nr:hypothetical protein SODALDRAFT_134392 [Sodiomyces alkalinus F11]ROT39620.1 hypothetical protein SODALDRAFT_134392 [Sodiomyces alkalinus F11]
MGENINSSAPFSMSGKTAIIAGAGSGASYALSIVPPPFSRETLHENQRTANSQESTSPSPSSSSPATATSSSPTCLACPGAGVYEPHWSNCAYQRRRAGHRAHAAVDGAPREERQPRRGAGRLDHAPRGGGGDVGVCRE